MDNKETWYSIEFERPQNVTQINITVKVEDTWYVGQATFIDDEPTPRTIVYTRGDLVQG